jgi:hypothetical protein
MRVAGDICGMGTPIRGPVTWISPADQLASSSAYGVAPSDERRDGERPLTPPLNGSADGGLRAMTTADKDALRTLLRSNEWMMRLLATVRDEHLPDAWIGAGVVRDLVWGERYGSGFRPEAVHDVNVAYFDPHDLSPANDDRTTKRLSGRWPEVPWQTHNDATAWYTRRLSGDPVQPITFITYAVATWPETATAVAVRLGADDTIEICAPLGLTDLLNGVWRRNPRRITLEQSLLRLARHHPQQRWPAVTVIPPD